MSQFKDYDEVVEPLAFPIRGKVYTAPPVPAKFGIALVRAIAGDEDALGELAGDSRSLYAALLGPAYDEMIADDVPLDALSRAGFAALVDWQAGRDAAVRVWESGIDPEARAALMAALRRGLTPSTGTGSARKTPSRASTKRTTSRTGTPRTRANPSSGKRS